MTAATMTPPARTMTPPNRPRFTVTNKALTGSLLYCPACQTDRPREAFLDHCQSADDALGLGMRCVSCIDEDGHRLTFSIQNNRAARTNPRTPLAAAWRTNWQARKDAQLRCIEYARSLGLRERLSPATGRLAVA